MLDGQGIVREVKEVQTLEGVLEMKERPIPFNGYEVLATLAGRQTMFRRAIIWPVWCEREDQEKLAYAISKKQSGIALYKDGRPSRRLTCPYGQPGDRLWVRETWNPGYNHDADHDDGPRVEIIYMAGLARRHVIPPGNDDERYAFAESWMREFSEDSPFDKPSKRPSIHMPRWASRLTLEVTGVKVERLQDISNEDAWAEGCRAYRDREYWNNDHGGAVVLADTPRDEFQGLWDSINAKRGLGWEVNPWVWVIGFKVVK